MKRVALGTMLVAVLLIVGAGCRLPWRNNPETTTPGTKPAGTTDTAPRDAREGDLRLTAEGEGNNSAKLDWTLVAGVREPELFRILYSRTANPSDNNNLRAVAVDGTERTVTWGNLETGEHHFRICVVKDNSCTTYSNDVSVTVNRTGGVVPTYTLDPSAK